MTYSSLLAFVFVGGLVACGSSSEGSHEGGVGGHAPAQAGDTGLGGGTVEEVGGAMGGAEPLSGGMGPGGTPVGSGGRTDSAGLGGRASGGAAAGGRVGAGGTVSAGGTLSGGAPAGGSESGGALAGGSESGGSPSGGTQAGGAETGGAETGGAEMGGAAAALCTSFGIPTVVGTIQSSALSELSGMVASRDQPGILYAHADSGSEAEVIAMTTEGQTLANLILEGLSPTDCEDIAVADGYIYLADIGDNSARTGTGTPRSQIRVYRFLEPTLSTTSDAGTITVSDYELFTFEYPDSAHDAETLLVDPVSGDLLILTKETDGQSQVFLAPAPLEAGSTTTLESVATLSLGDPGAESALLCGGDISPTGDRILGRTYAAIWLWVRDATWAETFSTAPLELPSATEPKGEGLTFSADGTSWFSAGETSTNIYQATSTCN